MGSTEEDIAWLKSTFHPIPKPALPDDCIEYSLHVVDPKFDSINPSEVRLQLRDVQKQANELQKQWLKDYIWQRQSFNLELLNENGVSFLRGRTEYGDSIEDEWVIVWLLRELTKNFPNLWAKVTDSDGEFLLIEASATLPAWLEPEVAENRVWINDGQLKIIRPASDTRSSKRTDEKLTIEDAHRIILSQPKRLMQSNNMQEDAFYRLRNYPGQIKDNMHHGLVQLPRKVAYLLLQKAAYVAPAIEAFYLRDPISLKPLQAKDAVDKLAFPPKDLVELGVRFPRVAYAQIKSQDFPVLDAWKSTMPPPSEPMARAHAETGMKLTCGFEMLLSDSHYQDRPHVREMKLLLEDIESGDASLPGDDELGQLEKRADDEKWMDINFEDLQQELNGGKSEAANGKGEKAEFGDRAAQENLQRIVKRFESFLDSDKMGDADSGLFDAGDSDTDELDDIDSDDLEEDKEAGFGEDEFSKIMQEMMGMPPEVMKEVMSGKIDALTNGAAPQGPLVPESSSKAGKQVEALSSSGESNDDEEIEELMRQMGSELKASGALDLDTSDVDEDDPEYAVKEGLVKNLLESFQSQGGGAGPASNLMALMAEQYPKQDKGKDVAKGKRSASNLDDGPD
ncbi:hypothetical protein LTR70_000996 [Exophiala xenobiotica]|uniref:Ecdysoneless n=1 Tax=Lithohypha guttulata TaxID=1690604 RepID=A0ABR0K0H6_9EURO|nr:hypothetical protein LTR24_008245 [Lithohypha guttulata]KAK5329159.1 hypothetical protein LTR70_000996 [Exophiala xenobiotica]